MSSHSLEEIRKIAHEPNVVSAQYDDQPNDVADRFVAFLRKNGFSVEEIHNNDLPILYYRIVKNSDL